MNEEPRRVIFPDSSDSQSIPSASSVKEPSALVFPPTAGTVASVKHIANQEPKPLVFREPHKSAPLVSVSKLKATLDAEPSAIVFSEHPALIPSRAPGDIGIKNPRHSAHANCLAWALAHSPSLNPDDHSRLERLLSSLLPVSKEVLENYGAKILGQCRDNAFQVARLGSKQLQLNASELLAQAVSALTAPVSLRQKFSQKILQLTGSPYAAWQLRLTTLRTELVTLLTEVRTLRPDAARHASRMALTLLALQSISTICSANPEPTLAFILDQRLETLRVALTQANIVPMQLAATESTISLQLIELDRLLNVTASAIALAKS